MTAYIVAKHTRRGETKAENVLHLSHLAPSFTLGAVMETHFSVRSGGGEGVCQCGKIGCVLVLFSVGDNGFLKELQSFSSLG